jgi:putative ABC transport system permease protein
MKKTPHLVLLAWRHSLKHTLQSLLLILGVALGVALIVGVDLANRSAHEAFILSSGVVGSQATHQIVAGSGGLPTSLYETLRLELGLRQVAPVVTGRVRLKNADNAYMQLMGVDPAAELSFTNFLGEKDEQTSLGALSHLLLTRDGVALSQTLSDEYKLAIGDTLTVVANSRHKRVRLAVLLETEDDVSRRALDGMIISDIGAAQVVLDKVGRIDYIDLALPPEADLQPIIDRLPPNARLQPAYWQTQTIREMVESFELSLSIASLLVLMAGMFLIYNTVSFSVVQRRPIWGILRCLGVTRREIFEAVLLEALALGIIGSFIGVGLGLVLGRELTGGVAGTVGEFYQLTVQRSMGLSPLIFYKGMVAGLVASLLAAFVPALEAMTIPPYNTLQRSVQERRIRRVIPVLTIAGGLLLVVGWLLLRYSTRSISLSFTTLFIFLTGFVLLTPILTRLLTAMFRPITAWGLGLIGRMAPRDIDRALSRTSVAIAALMLVVSTMVAIGIVITSFRYSITNWVENMVQADIYLMPLDRNALDPALIGELEQTPGIAQILPLWEATVISADYGPVTVRALNPGPEDDKMTGLWAIGNLQETQAALDAGAVAVTEAFARRHQLPLDKPSTLTLYTDDGPSPFKVVAIFHDYEAPGPGYIGMRPSIYQAHWQQQRITRISLYLTPELATQTETVMQNLKEQLSGQYAIFMLSGPGVKKSLLTGFERSFTVTNALRLLAAIVGFIGIFSTLMSLQFERTRELGVLRANGMSMLQLWGKTVLETILMGLVAGLMSIPVGLVFALIILQEVNQRFLGWVIQLYLTPPTLITALVLSLAAALLAGIYPAFRLSRLEIAAALREE